MSISRPQAGVAANASSATISSTAAADLILVFAYNATNNTIPTLAAGYTSILTATTANGAARVGYKKSTGSETTTGTWTNATRTVAIVLRSSTGWAWVNAFASTTGTGTVLTYLGMTVTNSAGNFFTNGNSWVVGFGGARSATAGMNGSTTHLTNEANVTTANGLDSEAGLSSFADETLSVTTSGEWITATIEVYEPKAALTTVNATQAVTYFLEMRRGGYGYLRRITPINDPYGMYHGIWTLSGDGLGGRVSEGTDGVNFAMGPLGNNKRTDVGSPSQPSQIQRGLGRIQMLIPVLAGSRTITLDCRYWPDSGAGFRPRLVIRRDLDVGVQDDMAVEAVAQSGTTFQTLTFTRTIPADGVLEIYREQQDPRQDAWVIWDKLSVT